MAILSPAITYGLADLPHRDGQTAAETMGAITRKMATLCNDPFVVARMGDADWIEVKGDAIWGCAAAPPDRRILAALLAVVATGVLMTVALNLPMSFLSFAGQLSNRRRVGGPTRYDPTGPQELQEIITAVNSYLEIEREHLAGRAAVLSGVSHDLGTPATPTASPARRVDPRPRLTQQIRNRHRQHDRHHRKRAEPIPMWKWVPKSRVICR